MPRIAVVDDDTTMLELMAEIVGEHDWDILPVQDTHTINDVARHEQPDAVIFDFCPGMLSTRWELLHRLKTEPATASIPVIIWLSDPRQFADQHEWLAAQNIPILSKPFELVDLHAHLDVLIDQPSVLMGCS
jgi:CheY-like chemotaxis protein